MYVTRKNTRNTHRDYGKALEALKLLTENVLREPHNHVMVLPVMLELIITVKSNDLLCFIALSAIGKHQ